MLPKPEKNKKITSDTETTPEISPEVKVKAKRQLVAILLIATFGLSFIFWAYRLLSTKSFVFKLPTLSSPKTTLNLSVPYSFKKNQQIITNSSSPNYEVLIPLLQKSNQSIPSDLLSVLPQGINLKYYQSENLTAFLFITPSDPFILVINSATLPPVDQLKTIISQVYWFGIKL